MLFVTISVICVRHHNDWYMEMFRRNWKLVRIALKDFPYTRIGSRSFRAPEYE